MGRRQMAFLMFDNYIIEIRPRFLAVTGQAGIIVRDGRAFRFFAATDAFNTLEGQLFKSQRAAEHAVLVCTGTALHKPSMSDIPAWRERPNAAPITRE